MSLSTPELVGLNVYAVDRCDHLCSASHVCSDQLYVYILPVFPQGMGTLARILHMGNVMLLLNRVPSMARHSAVLPDIGVLNKVHSRPCHLQEKGGNSGLVRQTWKFSFFDPM